MGCTPNTRTDSIVYNRPVDEMKEDGFSHVYRCAKHMNKLDDTPEPHITSIKDILVENCLKKFPNNPFLGRINVSKVEKDGQEVEERTLTKFKFREVFHMSQNLGTYLIKNQMLREDANEGLKLVGIFSKNRYEWLVSDIACCIFGVTIVPLYETLGMENLSYCLNHSEITTCFVSGETAKTLLKLKDHGKLTDLIIFDEISKQTEEQLEKLKIRVHSFQNAIKKREATQDFRNYKVGRDNILAFSYTSGTTGPPKGAMVSHGNVLAYLAAQKNNQIGLFTPDDVYLSFLPLPHILERDAIASMLYGGSFIAFYSGDILKVKEDAICVKPTIFVAVPRLYNRIVDGVKAKFENAGGISRCLAEGGVSSKIEAMQKNGSYTSSFYDGLVFSKVRENFGGRIRVMISGSAPIKPEVFEFMKAIMCCEFYEGYGQTQNTGAAFISYADDPVVGHVGAIVTSMEFKLQDIPEMHYTSNDKDDRGRSTPRGEIWLRGHSVFKGYYKDKAKTEETITPDGWLKTGDVGMLLPGSNAMRLIDRKKNIFKLQQGEYVAAEKVEAIYTRVPVVSEVFLHGQSHHNFAVAVISVKKNEFLELAKHHGVEKSYEELCEDAKIKTLICKELDSVGKSSGLMSFQQAKNIHIQPLTFQEKNVLSTTMKLQRFAAKKVWAKQIEAMYDQGQLNLK